MNNTKTINKPTRVFLNTTQCLSRYPRLIKVMKWTAILSDLEAAAAIRDYRGARIGVYDGDLVRTGGGEAVSHYGGPLKLIRSAIRCRKILKIL